MNRTIFPAAIARVAATAQAGIVAMGNTSASTIALTDDYCPASMGANHTSREKLAVLNCQGPALYGCYEVVGQEVWMRWIGEKTLPNRFKWPEFNRID